MDNPDGIKGIAAGRLPDPGSGEERDPSNKFASETDGELARRCSRRETASLILAFAVFVAVLILVNFAIGGLGADDSSLISVLLFVMSLLMSFACGYAALIAVNFVFSQGELYAEWGRRQRERGTGKGGPAEKA